MKKVCLASLVALLSIGLAVAEEIVIVGTGSGTSVLKAVGAAYTKAHPKVTITVPSSIGSGGGMRAVGKDKNILGRVAREIKQSEKSYGMTYLAYAKMPIVFFVHKEVTIKSLNYCNAPLFQGG